MEILLITLLVLVLLVSFIRISLLDNYWLIGGFVVLPIILTYILYPWLVEQNNGYIKLLLNQRTLMTDFSLLILLEALLVLGHIFALSQQHFDQKPKSIRVLNYVPTISPLLALIYFQLQAFYVIDSLSFEKIALWYACGAILASGVIIAALKWLLHEWEIRLELTFMLCLVQILIGIGFGSFYNSIVSSSIIGDEIWKPFIAILTMGGGVVLIGFLWARFRSMKDAKQSFNSIV